MRQFIGLAAALIIAAPAGNVAATAQTSTATNASHAVPALALDLPAAGVVLTHFAIQDGRLVVAGRTDEPNTTVKIDGRYYAISGADRRFRSSFPAPAT